MKMRFLFAVALAVSLAGARAEVREVTIDPGEHWWGVCNSFGTNMPFTAETRGFSADISALNYGGQPASLLLSDRGPSSCRRRSRGFRIS